MVLKPLEFLQASYYQLLALFLENFHEFIDLIGKRLNFNIKMSKICLMGQNSICYVLNGEVSSRSSLDLLISLLIIDRQLIQLYFYYMGICTKQPQSINRVKITSQNPQNSSQKNKMYYKPLEIVLNDNKNQETGTKSGETILINGLSLDHPDQLKAYFLAEKKKIQENQHLQKEKKMHMDQNGANDGNWLKPKTNRPRVTREDVVINETSSVMVFSENEESQLDIPRKKQNQTRKENGRQEKNNMTQSQRISLKSQTKSSQIKINRPQNKINPQRYLAL